MRLQRLFLAATFVASSTSALAAPFSQLFVFGDSLSDTGNFSIIGQTQLGVAVPAPPYAPGRASSGPLAIDHLAASLGLPLVPALAGGNNYAVIGAATGEVPIPGGGGATADNSAELLLGQQLPVNTGLVSQVGLFLSTRVAPLDPDALFFIWAGANDFFINPTDPAVAATAVARIAGAVDALHAAGAKRFLVPNLPDLSLTPDGVPDLQGATATFNTLLAQALAARSGQAGMQLVAFDTFTAFNTILASAGSYGILNVEDECFQGPPLGLGGGLPCAVPSAYLFWDNVHPGGTAHALLGTAFADAVQADAIPEPATMVLTVLGVAAAARKRRPAA